MNNQLLISKVKKSPFEKGGTRVSEGEGFKIPRLSATPFYKGGLKIVTAVIATIIISGYFLPLPVLALDYTPLAPLPGTTVTEDGKEVVKDAGGYIKGAFNLAIGIAAVLAIIMIIIGGIQYMGTESIGGKGAGLKKIKDAVLGLLLALGSWVILSTINPALVNFNVNIDAITPPAAPPPVATTPTMTSLGTNIRRAAIDVTKAAEKAFADGNSVEGNRLLTIADEMHAEDLKIANFDGRITNILTALNSGNLGGAQTVLPGLNNDINTEQQRLTNIASNTTNTDEKNRLLSLVDRLETLQTNFTNSTTQQINSGSYYFSYLERGTNENDILKSAGPYLSPELCQTAREEISERISTLNPQPGDTVRMIGGCGKQ